jgi:phage terminase small subunit
MTDLSTISARELRTLERNAEEKLQPRQIAFCRNVVFSGMQKLEAYKAAGYEAKRPDVQSSKLQRREDVQTLMRLYGETCKRKAVITGQTLQLTVWDIMEKSLEEKDNSTGLRAAELLAKMTGNMAAEKKEVEVKDKREALPKMDSEALKAGFAAARERQKLEVVDGGKGS